MPHPHLERREIPPALLRSGPRFFPFLLAGLVALTGWSGLLVSRPALWAPIWWACLLTGAVGSWLLLWDWHRLIRGAAVPISLVLNLAAMVILWAEPNALTGPILFVLTSAFIPAFFHWGAAALHILLVTGSLAGLLWKGVTFGKVILVAAGVLGVFAVMRFLHQRLREQAVQTDHLQRLMELMPVLKAHGLEDVVTAAVRHIVRATASDMGVVFLLDEPAQRLRPRYLHSEAPLSPEERRAMLTTEIAPGVGLSGWVAQHGQAVVTGDAARDPRAMQVPGTPRTDESIMAVPLMTDGRLYGVLRIDRKGINRYREEDLHLLELMAIHVSDAISRAQMEERMARRDALTGVYNRHFLNEWSERMESNPRQVSILMIDLRCFKQINDGWGHLEGDRVLQECAILISESVRSRDLVVRYGGDEFLVVLDDTGYEEAVAIADRLQNRVDEWNAAQGEGQPQLTLDIGIETAPQSDWQLLLDRADARMYACKPRV